MLSIRRLVFTANWVSDDRAATSAGQLQDQHNESGHENQPHESANLIGESTVDISQPTVLTRPRKLYLDEWEKDPPPDR